MPRKLKPVVSSAEFLDDIGLPPMAAEPVAPVSVLVPAPAVEALAPVEAKAVKVAPVLRGEAASIAESRKSLDTVLGMGQAFFESPEGYVIIGDSDRNHVWCRQANGGKGCFINPRR